MKPVFETGDDGIAYARAARVSGRTKSVRLSGSARYLVVRVAGAANDTALRTLRGDARLTS